MTPRLGDLRRRTCACSRPDRGGSYFMLTRITRPGCGHVGVSPSVTRDEQAALRAAWERYEATDKPPTSWP